MPTPATSGPGWWRRSGGCASRWMADLVVRRAARVFGWDLDGPLAIVIRDGVVELVLRDGDVDVDLPELDAGGGAVIPGFVDAHTHLVFAGDRADEFAARLAGRPYEAGGIMRTVEATRAAPFESLVNETVRRAGACLAGGT